MRSLLFDIAAKAFITVFLCAYGYCGLRDWVRDVRKPKCAG